MNTDCCEGGALIKDEILFIFDRFPAGALWLLLFFPFFFFGGRGRFAGLLSHKGYPGTMPGTLCLGPGFEVCIA